jgi:3-oxoacyl-[acyl-carrier-protein] synthase III
MNTITANPVGVYVPDLFFKQYWNNGRYNDEWITLWTGIKEKKNSADKGTSYLAISGARFISKRKLIP